MVISKHHPIRSWNLYTYPTRYSILFAGSCEKNQWCSLSLQLLFLACLCVNLAENVCVVESSDFGTRVHIFKTFCFNCKSFQSFDWYSDVRDVRYENKLKFITWRHNTRDIALKGDFVTSDALSGYAETSALSWTSANWRYFWAADWCCGHLWGRLTGVAGTFEAFWLVLRAPLRPANWCCWYHWGRNRLYIFSS